MPLQSVPARRHPPERDAMGGYRIGHRINIAGQLTAGRFRG
jgi:hypothetical protein